MGIEIPKVPIELSSVERATAFMSFLELWTAAPLNLYLLYKLYRERDATHALILSMSWILLADLGMIINYIPFKGAEIMELHFPMGNWCLFSGFLSLIFVVFSNLSSTALAYVTFRSMGLGAKGYGQQFTQNYLRNTCLLILPGIVFASIELSAGQIGNYRNMYCAIRDPGEWAPGLWMTAFMFTACSIVQTRYYTKAYAYVKQQMQKTESLTERNHVPATFRPNIHAVNMGRMNAEKQKEQQIRNEFLAGMRNHAWRMSALFPLMWTPVMLLALVSYAHGGVYTEKGGWSHAIWLDVVSVFCIKIVPLLDTYVVHRALSNARVTQKKRQRLGQARMSAQPLPPSNGQLSPSAAKGNQKSLGLGSPNPTLEQSGYEFGKSVALSNVSNEMAALNGVHSDDEGREEENGHSSAHEEEVAVDIEIVPDSETDSQVRAGVPFGEFAFDSPGGSETGKSPGSFGSKHRRIQSDTANLVRAKKPASRATSAAPSFGSAEQMLKSVAEGIPAVRSASNQAVRSDSNKAVRSTSNKAVRSTSNKAVRSTSDKAAKPGTPRVTDPVRKLRNIANRSNSVHPESADRESQASPLVADLNEGEEARHLNEDFLVLHGVLSGYKLDIATDGTHGSEYDDTEVV